jgi:hypothetical protein
MGTVVFKDGSQMLGSGNVTINGQGQAVATFTQTGTRLNGHTIIASYSGDTNFQASDSAPALQTFSVTTLRSSAASAVFGQGVVLTANVHTLKANTVKPTGDVTFLDGGTVLGTATLTASRSGGTATLSLPPLAVGRHTLRVVYQGDSTFDSSATAPLTQTIKPASTTTRLTVSSPTVSASTPVTFTATIQVKTPGAGTPGGSVTFLDGQTTLGAPTVQVINGMVEATWTGSLSKGAHKIKAIYSGDPSFKTSLSAVLTLTVTA